MHTGFLCGEYSLKHLPSRYLPFPDRSKLITPLLVTSTRSSKDSGAMLARPDPGTVWHSSPSWRYLCPYICAPKIYEAFCSSVLLLFCRCVTSCLFFFYFRAGPNTFQRAVPGSWCVDSLAASNCGRVCTRVALLAVSQRPKIPCKFHSPKPKISL